MIPTPPDELSPDDLALVAFLQAHAPLPPPPSPQLEEQILALWAGLDTQTDQALVAFLATHAPQPPTAPADLEERLMAALDQDRDAGLVAFLQVHAPQPPDPPAALEERILAALTPSKKVPAWWGGLAAAGLIVGVLLGAQNLFLSQPMPPKEADLVLDLPTGSTGLFAEDPDTGLYDVRL